MHAFSRRLTGLAALVPLILASFLLAACPAPPDAGVSAPVLPSPPVAKIVPHELEKHGDVRVDNYYWLRERENPEVISYLDAENAYTEAALKHTEPLQEKLYEEIVARIKKDDESVPYMRDGYYYYARFVEGGEYALNCRKKGSLDAEEEILLDGNKLAEGHEFFALRGLSISSNQDILSYAVDTVGRRLYTIYFKDLKTGELLPDKLVDVTSNVAWAEDNKTIFYTKQHPETLRSYQIYRHTLGTDQASDELIYEEKDDTFNAFVFKTRSKKYIMIGSRHTLMREYRYLDTADPMGEFKLFQERDRSFEYAVDHFGDDFYIRTNMDAKNFRLMKTPISATGKENWTDVIPHRDDVFLAAFTLFSKYMVISERKAGLVQMRIMPFEGEEHYIDFGEPAYTAFPGANFDFDTDMLRYGYSSLTTPRSTFDYNMATREKTLLKEQEVVGDFDKNNYETERLMVPARDGKEIPVSIVYRKGTAKDGSHPLLLNAYGSYGLTLDPTFNAARLSLLDRGFVFALAHIRGGQVMGREWYEDGKLFNKKNTFTDFIDVGDYLVKENYTKPERLFAEGGSAGGLLMGAVVNLRPELFRGVHAAVPFVDVVTTMLDEDIPLTTGEYDEWGDPNQKDYYDYMLSYSPYDNVEAKNYPNLLVTTGLHDSQVQYWEPAKWVAKLRAFKTDDNLLLLHTNMEAGHGGSTGRFKRFKRTAMTYAFMLDLAGIQE